MVGGKFHGLKRNAISSFQNFTILLQFDPIIARLITMWFSIHPGPEVIKLFSISAQLSMKFQLLINVEIIIISGKFRFKTQKLVIYPANKC